MVAQTLLALAIVWIVIVYTLKWTTRFLTSLTLRIADSPKGTIAAMGGFFGGVGGIIKSLMG